MEEAEDPVALDKGSAKKRLLHADRTSMAQRQCTWLQRDNRDVAPVTWRPYKVHRAAARRFVAHIDTQLQVSAGESGLAFCFSCPRRLLSGMGFGAIGAHGRT